MEFTIDPTIEVAVGYLELDGCEIHPSSVALRALYDGAANAAAERFAGSSIGEHPVASGVRRLFKSVGIDPSRYRPSGEALVRRIIKGQDLYHINNIVDINNLCSIESLFPLGAYDRANIEGDVTIRLGRRDESYEGIGREISISGKLTSADDRGPFGSPISDSERTKITEESHDILVLLYAPPSTDRGEILGTLDRFADLAGAHSGARRGHSGVHGPG